MASWRGNAVAALLLLLLPPLCRGEHEATKVQLSLYYETLCPYCSRFIVNRLPDIFANGLLPFVDLQLFPFGNARVAGNGSISCQHGPSECFLNTVEACAIHAWPNVNEHFQFIYCVEKLVVEGRYLEWESCFLQLNLNPGSVMDCIYSGYGHQLDLYYAAATGALIPPHQYVPWVVVDGRPLYEDYENFETEICKTFKMEMPPACKNLQLEMPLGKQAVGTCKADEKGHWLINVQHEESS